MEVNVAVKEPRSRIIGLEVQSSAYDQGGESCSPYLKADGNIVESGISWVADADHVTAGRIHIVVF